MKSSDFDEIYREYFKDVFLYLMSLCGSKALAEELTQEAFIKAMKGIDQFHGKCRLRVWLCQIAKNEYFMYLRSAGRNETAETDFRDDLAKETGCQARFEEQLEDSETALDIHRILHTLDEPYKEVFSLRTFGELSFRQIAQVFGRTESWARVTYHRARLKIIEHMEKKNSSGGSKHEQD